MACLSCIFCWRKIESGRMIVCSDECQTIWDEWYYSPEARKFRPHEYWLHRTNKEDGIAASRR